jgi:hypothetical protein
MGWSLPTNAANCISQQLEQQNVLLTHEKQLGELLCSDLAKDFLAVQRFQGAHTLPGDLWNHHQSADSAIKKDIRLAQRLGSSRIPLFVMSGQNLSGG